MSFSSTFAGTRILLSNLLLKVSRKVVIKLSRKKFSREAELQKGSARKQDKVLNKSS